jgi:hypothetical protein
MLLVPPLTETVSCWPFSTSDRVVAVAERQGVAVARHRYVVVAAAAKHGTAAVARQRHAVVAAVGGDGIAAQAEVDRIGAGTDSEAIPTAAERDRIVAECDRIVAVAECDRIVAVAEADRVGPVAEMNGVPAAAGYGVPAIGSGDDNGAVAESERVVLARRLEIGVLVAGSVARRGARSRSARNSSKSITTLSRSKLSPLAESCFSRSSTSKKPPVPASPPPSADPAHRITNPPKLRGLWKSPIDIQFTLKAKSRPQYLFIVLTLARSPVSTLLARPRLCGKFGVLYATLVSDPFNALSAYT